GDQVIRSFFAFFAWPGPPASWWPFDGSRHAARKPVSPFAEKYCFSITCVMFGESGPRPCPDAFSHAKQKRSNKVRTHQRAIRGDEHAALAEHALNHCF
ncbi:MAG TPA: hypothetical protein VN259_06385, partial [Xanthomonadales bacterium]|nr:hypothetical protein [Xanthomonadales bacterium]